MAHRLPVAYLSCQDLRIHSVGVRWVVRLVGGTIILVVLFLRVATRSAAVLLLRSCCCWLLWQSLGSTPSPYRPYGGRIESYVIVRIIRTIMIDVCCSVSVFVCFFGISSFVHGMLLNRAFLFSIFPLLFAGVGGACCMFVRVSKFMSFIPFRCARTRFLRGNISESTSVVLFYCSSHLSPSHILFSFFLPRCM